MSERFAEVSSANSKACFLVSRLSRTSLVPGSPGTCFIGITSIAGLCKISRIGRSVLFIRPCSEPHMQDSDWSAQRCPWSTSTHASSLESPFGRSARLVNAPAKDPPLCTARTDSVHPPPGRALGLACVARLDKPANDFSKTSSSSSPCSWSTDRAGQILSF